VVCYPIPQLTPFWFSMISGSSRPIWATKAAIGLDIRPPERS